VEPEFDVGRLGIAEETGTIEQRGKRGPRGLGQAKPTAFLFEVRARSEKELNEAEIDFRQSRQVDVKIAARLDSLKELASEFASASHGNRAGRLDYLRHVVPIPAKNGPHFGGADLPLLFRGKCRDSPDRKGFFWANMALIFPIVGKVL
jgi:hypothetical protein